MWERFKQQLDLFEIYLSEIDLSKVFFYLVKQIKLCQFLKIPVYSCLIMSHFLNTVTAISTVFVIPHAPGLTSNA